jgi:gas vesicle protein
MGVPEKVAEIVEIAKEKTAEAAGWVEEKAHNLKESLEQKKEATATEAAEIIISETTEETKQPE